MNANAQRRPASRRVAGAMAGAVLIASSAVWAQQPQTPQTPPQSPVFRSTTSLVLLNVTVLDKDGRPVPGLTADDFKVKLDGKERAVRLVNYLQIAAPLDAPPAIPDATADVAPARAAAAAQAAAPAQRRTIVLMVDDLSMTPDRGKSLLAAASRFVQALPPTDLVGFATSSTSAVIAPTTDHLVVAAALPRAAGQLNDPALTFGPAMGMGESVEIYDGNSMLETQVILRDCFPGQSTIPPANLQNGPQKQCIDDVGRRARQEGAIVQATADRQIRSFLAVVSALKPLPGLKQVVLISAGLTLTQRRQSAVALEPLARTAAAAGVQVTVLNEEPDRANLQVTDTAHSYLSTDPGIASVSNGQIVTQVKRDDDLSLQQGIQTVADLTGGQYYRVIGLADPFFSRVASATSALYEIGVEAPDGNAKPGKDYALSVSVAKPGLTARANHHALVPEPAKPVPVETQLTNAIASGAPLYGIPIAVGSSVRRGTENGQVAVDLDIDVPASTPGPLQMVFGLVDAMGVVKSGKKAVDPPSGGGDYRVSLAVPIASGNYQIRLAVADAQGHVGSVESRVKATLTPMGPFQASDLLTGWSAQNGPAQFLALGRLPPGAARLLTQLELYPTPGAALPADVKVHVTISTLDGTPLDDRTITPAIENGALRAQSAFDLQYIPAGAYVLKADVTAAGAVLGTTSANVRIMGPGNTPQS